MCVFLVWNIWLMFKHTDKNLEFVFKMVKTSF